jgi:hypothetical protein
MTSRIPLAAINAAAPTSRSTFRHLVGCIAATNRGADTLRHALLGQWNEHAEVQALVRRLRSLDHLDPDGALGVDARLAVWFWYADPGDGRLIAEDDPILVGLSDDLCNRLVETSRPAQD